MEYRKPRETNILIKYKEGSHGSSARQVGDQQEESTIQTELGIREWHDVGAADEEHFSRSRQVEDLLGMVLHLAGVLDGLADRIQTRPGLLREVAARNVEDTLLSDEFVDDARNGIRLPVLPRQLPPLDAHAEDALEHWEMVRRDDEALLLEIGRKD